jgi:hypothetical protein
MSPDSVCTLAGTFTSLRGALLFSGCGETMANLLKMLGFRSCRRIRHFGRDVHTTSCERGI